MSLSQTSAAISENDFSLKQYLSYNYPKWTILEYPSANDAIKAMRTGNADCYVTRAGQLPRYMKDKTLIPQCSSHSRARPRSPYGRAIRFAVHPEQNAQNHAFFPADRCTCHVRQCARKGHRCGLCQGQSDYCLCCVHPALSAAVRSVPQSPAVRQTGAGAEPQAASRARQQLQEALTQAKAANAAKTTFLNTCRTISAHHQRHHRHADYHPKK